MIHSLDEATKRFLTYSPLSVKSSYTLDRMRHLMDLFGNPQDTFKVIHIAGTSGKTSTAYFIRGLLETAGKRTGLTVSPHIVGLNDRVQVAGVPLDEQRFVDYANRFFERIEKTSFQPTYFELLITFAYWVFAEEKVEYSVIETGLGGLLDGTNVVTRADKVCVITDIGLDHMEVLGDTVSKIAAQKAGIIQSHNHVFIRQQGDEVMDVVAHVAQHQKAQLHRVSDGPLPLGLPSMQAHNWAMAEAVYEYVSTRDHLTSLGDAVKHEVVHQTPPGRWEVHTFGEKTIIFDGAHNAQKMEALSATLRQNNMKEVAALANFIITPSDRAEMAAEVIAPFLRYVIIPEFAVGQDLKSRRSLTGVECEALFRSLGRKDVAVIPDLSAAVRSLLARPERTLLITGSLYLISLARPIVLAELEAQLPSSHAQ